MRVILRSGVMSSQEHRGRLPGLLDFAVEGRHDVLIDPDAREHWEQWLNTRGDDAAGYVRAEQDSQKRQAITPSDAEVIVDDHPPNYENPRRILLPLPEAILFLRMPLIIGVEDETSDRLFLNTVVPPPLKEHWMKLQEIDAVKPWNLGGVTQVPRRVQTLAEQGDRHLRRAVLLIDSDTPKPWERPRQLDTSVRKARAAGVCHKIDVYVLQRRMAENYIPVAALERWVTSCKGDSTRDQRSAHIEVYKRLSKGRRHHHHLKLGLRPAEMDHYIDEPLTAADRAALGNSLGGDVYEAFTSAEEADLRSDGVHDEFLPFFNAIFRLA